MKKLVIIGFFALLSNLTFAQENVVKMNPLGFAFGIFNLKWEHALNERTSFQLGGNFYSRKFGDVKFTGFGLDAEYRYYITNRRKPAPEGFYIGPNIGFDINSVNEDNSSSDGSISLLGIGATIGYQWIWDSGFALELGAGPQYVFVAVQDDGIDETIDFNGILPRLVFAIGYAF